MAASPEDRPGESPRVPRGRQNPAYRSALSLLNTGQRIMCSFLRGQNTRVPKADFKEPPRDPLLLQAWELDRDVCFDEESTKPAGERKWVRDILRNAKDM